jgi:hypothetical protein
VADDPISHKAEQLDVSKPTGEGQQPSKIHAWVDTINKLVQIVAVLVAAIWTWSVFSRTNAPGLEPKLNVRSELSWSDTDDKDVCTAAFHMGAKNDGQRAIEIETISVAAQIVDLNTLPKPPESGEPLPIDLKFIREHGHELDVGDAEPLPTDLVDHYAPGVQDDSEATFRFRRSPNRLILFRADLTGRESRVLLPLTRLKSLSDYTWQSDQLCGQKISSPKVTKAK